MKTTRHFLTLPPVFRFEFPINSSTQSLSHSSSSIIETHTITTAVFPHTLHAINAHLNEIERNVQRKEN